MYLAPFFARAWPKYKQIKDGSSLYPAFLAFIPVQQKRRKISNSTTRQKIGQIEVLFAGKHFSKYRTQRKVSDIVDPRSNHTV